MIPWHDIHHHSSLSVDVGRRGRGLAPVSAAPRAAVCSPRRALATYIRFHKRMVLYGEFLKTKSSTIFVWFCCVEVEYDVV